MGGSAVLSKMKLKG